MVARSTVPPLLHHKAVSAKAWGMPSHHCAGHPVGWLCRRQLKVLQHVLWQWQNSSKCL